MSSLIEKVALPPSTRGPWRIERFEASEDESKFAGLRAVISGGGRGYLPPGTYTRLVHERRGLIMSDTPDEMRDHWEPVRRARGHVLINGLGLGMVLAAVLNRDGVDRVTVVEIDSDLIAMVGPHYTNPRVEIVHADAFAYKPENASYGVVWHDIWDSICGDNLTGMTRLKRKYGRRADWQGCWAEYHCRRHARAS